MPSQENDLWNPGAMDAFIGCCMKVWLWITLGRWLAPGPVGRSFGWMVHIFGWLCCNKNGLRLEIWSIKILLIIIIFMNWEYRHCKNAGFPPHWDAGCL